MATDSSLNAHLLSLLEEATQELPSVSARRMFGCDALFTNKAIFALVWKAGRIGLKIPDLSLYQTLLSLPGAEPWAPGDMKPMAHWLLVPEVFHDDLDLLARWVRNAHRLAAASLPKAPKPTAAKTRKD